MTEIGMALSNPLHGERVPGSVGTPLPGVEVDWPERGIPLARNTGRDRGPRASRVRGILGQTRRHTRCLSRWMVSHRRYCGRRRRVSHFWSDQIDILKTGGHKVSALEIEETLRQHPAIAECSVVGVPDPEWGERVAAAVVLQDGAALDLQSLRTWARELLTPYKLPSRLLVVDALPRNAMGKVMKPALAPLFQTKGADPVA